MRENTRCEVEEPISTPTLSTTISSSSTSERPVEEKKTRPPSASSALMTSRSCPGRQERGRLAERMETRDPAQESRSASSGFLPRPEAWVPALARAQQPCSTAPLAALARPGHENQREWQQHLLRAHEFRHHRALLVKV